MCFSRRRSECTASTEAIEMPTIYYIRNRWHNNKQVPRSKKRERAKSDQQKNSTNNSLKGKKKQCSKMRCE